LKIATVAARSAALILAVALSVSRATPASPVLQAEPAPAPSPLPGEIVPEFDAVALAGHVQHVDYPKGSATILLFFLSSCPHCHKMIPEWNRAYERKPDGLTVIGVLMDQEPPGFFMAMPISFPVVRSPGRAFLQSYKVHRAPMTVRIGAGGKVEDAAAGIVDGIRLGQLMKP
jgi:thiol-disulfide isomerase/thioredoxin